MPTTPTVTLRCADCGVLLAEYHRLVLDPRRRSRLEAQARDLLEWHLTEAKDCRAGAPILSEVPPRGR